ncbi:MAG: dihydroorotate dehydrogenase [Thermoplasmata archaeon HGW-Thermoplasmata-1]|nr:MAG: dihydroorotate dehydrogenase [Thermoplasmata archaeon HGW-Thermoplasmata-1]
MKTSIGKTELVNPALLASGILDETAGSMLRVIDGGAAGCVTKSIGREARGGHPNPTMVELQCGLLNAMGLPNPGIESYAEEIAEFKSGIAARGIDAKLIGSVYGGDEKDFAMMAGLMANTGVDALELNVSCPHARGYGAQIGSDPDMVRKVVSAVKGAVKLPVFVKLTPNVSNVALIAKAAEEGGADAVVAINTVKAMAIDIESGHPVLGNKVGGYSGPAIKPIGVRAVYDIYKEVNIPIIGVGGITKGQDLLEYAMAGASAVQIGSAVYYRDVPVFGEIVKEAKSWLEERGFSSFKEIVGRTHDI